MCRKSNMSKAACKMKAFLAILISLGILQSGVRAAEPTPKGGACSPRAKGFGGSGQFDESGL